jgi:hypothetical protein
MEQQAKAPLKLLLRGAPEDLAEMLRKPNCGAALGPLLCAILLGTGTYGAAVGLWRGELQAAYVAAKMPLLIISTLLLTGVLNGMLGQVLGAGLSFAQSLRMSLMCFAVVAMILGGLSPVLIFAVLDAPGPFDVGAADWYRGFLLINTLLIAFAGLVANAKLLLTLHAFTNSTAVAWNTFIAWVAAQLFVGAQLSYNLRPFFSNPDFPVEFLRPQPFDGTFYGVAWDIAEAALGGTWHTVTVLAGLAALFTMMLLMSRRKLLAQTPPKFPNLP